GDWLTFCGEPMARLSQQFGVSISAICQAIDRSSRGARWIEPLANRLGLPVEVLLNIDPLSSEAAEHRGRALDKAGRRRLAEKGLPSTRQQSIQRYWKSDAAKHRRVKADAA